MTLDVAIFNALVTARRTEASQGDALERAQEVTRTAEDEVRTIVAQRAVELVPELEAWTERPDTISPLYNARYSTPVEVRDNRSVTLVIVTGITTISYIDSNQHGYLNPQGRLQFSPYPFSSVETAREAHVLALGHLLSSQAFAEAQIASKS